MRDYAHPLFQLFYRFFPITYSQGACTNFGAKQNVKIRSSAQECAFCGTRTRSLTFSPKTVTFWTPFRRDNFFSPANGISIGQLKSQRPLIVVLVPKSCIVNRQIGFGYSKNVIVPDLLLTAHVIQHMRSVRVRIFKGNQWGTLSLSSRSLYQLQTWRKLSPRGSTRVVYFLGQ